MEERTDLNVQPFVSNSLTTGGLIAFIEPIELVAMELLENDAVGRCLLLGVSEFNDALLEFKLEEEALDIWPGMLIGSLPFVILNRGLDTDSFHVLYFRALCPKLLEFKRIFITFRII